MSFKIGFQDTTDKPVNETDISYQAPAEKVIRSVVRVYFPARDVTLAYYNDRFDLHVGDVVYVEGKLEGMMGHISEVSYNYKIDLKFFKRVIAVVDTNVHGKLLLEGSNFLTFDRTVLPREKVKPWFTPPTEEGEIVTGLDDTSFLLHHIGEMDIDSDEADKGSTLYLRNSVKYLSLDKTKGYAIVEDKKPFEVEFEYDKGRISSLVCSCFLGAACCHEFAVILELREILERIEERYSRQFEKSDYFAAVKKSDFFSLVVGDKEGGEIVL